jgi:diguanylate cyclase (GGDEF)-like protein
MTQPQQPIPNPELQGVNWGPDPNAPWIVSLEPGQYDGRSALFEPIHASRIVRALELLQQSGGYDLRVATAAALVGVEDPEALEFYAQKVVGDAYKEHEGWTQANPDWNAKDAFLAYKERVLTQEATRDPLTSLNNRRALFRELKGLLEWATGNRRVALLLLDINNFKYVNDEFGHEEGDRVLVEVAKALVHVTRFDSDIVAARHGGDEFVAVAPIDGNGRSIYQDEHEPKKLSIEERANIFAERVTERLNSVLTYFNESFNVPADKRLGVSVGLAISTQNSTPASLLRQADFAMYLVKNRIKQAEAEAIKRQRQENLAADRTRLGFIGRLTLRASKVFLKKLPHQQELVSGIEELLDQKSNQDS